MPGAASDEPALPDPIMTPGAVDRGISLAVICKGTTKTRRPHTTRICEQVFAAYSIPPADRYQYECHHLVPIALGGSSVATNLWPQPNAEAARKDVLEVEMQRLVCHGILPFAQGQREIADDWSSAYERYVVEHRPPVVARAPSLSERLRAAFGRLSQF